MAELDPWGSSSIDDYSRLSEEFGIKEFSKSILNSSQKIKPMDLMRRKIIFGHRDYENISKAISNKDDFAALSGFMPSGEPHIGNMMVMNELIWHQKQGAETHFVIADMEAKAARGMTEKECQKYAKSYTASMIALGFDTEKGHIYKQSENRELRKLAFELSQETNFNELEGIYGFDKETSIGHIESVLTQTADILYPQLKKPKPTVIPVGIDQDPHIRLTRELARRSRYFGVTEAYASFELKPKWKPKVKEALKKLGDKTESRKIAEQLKGKVENKLIKTLKSGGKEKLKHRIRVISRKAPKESFKKIKKTLNEKYEIQEFEKHIDIFNASKLKIEEIVREIEIKEGGHGFYPPSSIYHRFMTGLKGGKMSSSIPKSHIALTDKPQKGHEKVKDAETGGRETAQKQRELGGKPDECPIYELYAYTVAKNDEHAKKVYKECKSGERLCGECKQEAAELTSQFLKKHNEERKKAKEKIEKENII